MSSGPRVLLAGGGSAGHVNPLLAVAAHLRDRGMRVEALGTDTGLETDLVPQAGLTLHTIAKVPAPRGLNATALTFVPKLKATVDDVERIIRTTGVEAIVGFGGYVSAPAYLAAKRHGIPFAIHEQNARPGLANRLGARWANIVGLTFEQTKLEAKRGITDVVGLPLRREIEELAVARRDPRAREDARREAARELGIDPTRPTLLITGGSLGAQRLNDVLSASAGCFGADIQVLHLTGKGKTDGVEKTVRTSGFSGTWKVFDYAHNMAAMLAAADLVVCRAGAGTVSELTALGMPAIYVPLPIGNGEQKLNAHAHVKSGGAMVFDNADFVEKIVQLYIAPLIASPHRLEKMSVASSQLGRIDAAARMAELTESLLESNPQVIQ
ncbi:MAG: undecaprenyldiphospho-muramoylpentapeptide beta-N-acetylglucosaminyltransferase [Actinomycetaceae bacterium]|nr:undecaprenyldiphospho-muramoylpentapeptide beta-N-acetylglucosaminyltransferase [Actinomycetaceae bacterium]